MVTIEIDSAFAIVIVMMIVSGWLSVIAVAVAIISVVNTISGWHRIRRCYFIITKVVALHSVSSCLVKAREYLLCVLHFSTKKTLK